MSSTLKDSVTAGMKSAMKAREKETLAAIRLILSEFKRVEVDERVELDDTRCLSILDKMLKQRHDAIKQFQAADRADLIAKEQQEIDVIASFMPAPLTEAEVHDAVASAMQSTGASAMSDMGRVMAILKPQLQGRADLSEVSRLVKAQLS